MLDGTIIAGPHVRAACKRHLEDLRTAAARGLHFDAALAVDAIEFFPAVLVLNGEGFEGAPFNLLDWEQFVVGCLFGWRRSEDNTRRFRVAYIETAKGSGKSPLAAGLGIKGLCADNTPRAEIYAAATTRDQANVLFRDAIAMVRQSPELARRCIINGALGREYNIAYHYAHSFYRPLSKEEAEKSGKRPHITLVDELHEHPDDTMIEMARAGLKNRRNGLVFVITNSGSDKLSVCGQYHDTAVKVSHGQLQDDSFFAYVCAHDEGEDPFSSETCWYKTNPSLAHGLPGLQYLREQVAGARGLPAREAMVRRLNFCEWTAADSPAISRHVWVQAQRNYTLADMKGRRAYGGLDLSSTTDLTAYVLNFEPREPGEPWAAFAWFWLPDDNLAERERKDRVPYGLWKHQGHLLTTPGGAVNKRHVARVIAQTAAEHNIVTIGYDLWGVAALKTILQEEGISLPLVGFGQGYKSMGPAWAEFEERLINGRQAHPGHPVLTWNAANAVTVTDPAGNHKPAKDRATGRIDGLVALVMSIGVSLSPAEQRIVHVQPFVNLNA